jgi:uncharacterized flavoprotein (TIGR03862 family)
MAAEMLAAAGVSVMLIEAMPSLGRKFLMAGRGGLNLTHSEPFDRFIARYGDQASWLAPQLESFGPPALRDWVHDLGIETFVGTSGRVFPVGLKASPLLRAWITRLVRLGVTIRVRHRFMGFEGPGLLRLAGPDGAYSEPVDLVVLAMGGASWPKLGSTGAWVPILDRLGIPIAPLRPANCGFTVAWSPNFRQKWAGTPLKSIRLSHAGRAAAGEAVVTENGIEGGAIYALSAALRDAIDRDGRAVLGLDLKPGLSEADLVQRLNRPRQGASLSNFLRKIAALPPIAASLLRECGGAVPTDDPATLARAIKFAALRLEAPFSLDRAISTAGGVRLDALDQHLMLKDRPGVFVAGEMLDWEAPTGGYLLQACFATGRAAALGALSWLDEVFP